MAENKGMADLMIHPWEDPNLMMLYHVQLETRDLIVSYEVATPDFNAVEVAMDHLRERLRDPHVPIHYGGGGSIGYHPIGDGRPVVIEWKVTTGAATKMVIEPYEEHESGRSVDAG